MTEGPDLRGAPKARRGAAARSSEINRILGSIGGSERWSHLHGEDRTAATRTARSASPGALEYWERKVDPDGVMSPADRAKCAGAAKREHFARLALASAKARRGRRPRAPDRPLTAEQIRIDAFRKRVMVPSWNGRAGFRVGAPAKTKRSISR
jgi:hypothetical protein